MRKDRLAAGEASSQTYVASENATQQQWDLAFMSVHEYTRKYSITTDEYSQLIAGGHQSNT